MRDDVCERLQAERVKELVQRSIDAPGAKRELQEVRRATQFDLSAYCRAFHAVPLLGLLGYGFDALLVGATGERGAADALRGLKMFEKLDVPILGIVENMSGEFFGTGAGARLAADYQADYLGSVPMDANVRVGGDNGQPIVVAFPDSPAANAIEDIAQKVAARISVLALQKSNNFIPIELVG